MIDRYSRKEIKNIWSEENKYKIWLDVEVAATKLFQEEFQQLLKKKEKLKLKEFMILRLKLNTM